MTTKTTYVAKGTLDWEKAALFRRSNQSLAYRQWKPPSSADAEVGFQCTGRFRVPNQPPQHGTEYNGIALPDTCFKGSGPHHVFVIGDWGGVLANATAEPVPADRRSKHMPTHYRPFIKGADDCAQQKVAKQMKLRSRIAAPDYVLNMGDNFYWGGVLVQCGAPMPGVADHSGQWEAVYERLYAFEGLHGKQWLGVLGTTIMVQGRPHPAIVNITQMRSLILS